jgi:hypothetical protein
MSIETLELNSLAQAARQHKHVVRVNGNVRIDASYQADLRRVTWSLNGLSASADQISDALRAQRVIADD